MFDDIGYSRSRAVARATKQTPSLVVACGYNGTDYGYFVCTETLVNGSYFYTDQLAFFKKQTELTYTEALTALNGYAADTKR